MTAGPDMLLEPPPLRRPLCMAAGMFALGCLAGMAGWGAPVFWLLPAAAALLVSCVFSRHGWSTATLWIGVFLAGAGWAGLRVSPPDPTWVGHRLAWDEVSFTATGVIADVPREFRWEDRDGYSLLATLALEQRDEGEAATRCTGRVDLRLTGQGTAPDLRYGDRVRLHGVMRRMPPERGWGPDAFRLSADTDEVEILSRGEGWLLQAWSYRAREACAARLAKGIGDQPEAVSLIRALMLGIREEISRPVRDAFAKTGTLHILAISGMHVGILAGLFLLALRSAGVSRIHWVWYLAPFLGLYTLATGSPVSAARASLMAVCYWLGPALYRKPDPPSAFALAAMVLLAIDPREILSPGFQLSFAVVGGLLALTPVIQGWLDPLGKRDPWAAGEEAGWLASARGWLGSVKALAAVSVAAWLSSMPLIAWHFNLVSPIALPANLVIVPLTFLLLSAGAVSLTLGWILPGVSFLMNHAVAGLSWALLGSVGWMEQVPLNHWFVPSPPGWMVLAWYPALVLCFFATRRMRLAGAAGAVALLAAMAGTPWFPKETSFTGWRQGEAAVYLVRSGARAALIDTGPAYAGRRLVDRLRKQGVNRLDVVVLATPSVRHAGAFPELAKAMEIGEVWAAPEAVHARGYNHLVRDVEAAGVPVRRLAAGDAGVFAGDLIWEVLHPEREAEARTMREAALVIRWMEEAESWTHYAFLEPGVLGRVAEANRIAKTRVVLAGVVEDEDAWPREWFEAARAEEIRLPVEE